MISMRRATAFAVSQAGRRQQSKVIATIGRGSVRREPNRTFVSSQTRSNPRPLFPFLNDGQSSWAKLVPTPLTGTMTKIVCTLGPSTDVESQVSQLVSSGMHVARLNFSHAGDDYTYPTTLMNLVRNASDFNDDLSAGAVNSKNMPKNLRAILVDTKGPEIRTRPLQGNVEVANIGSGAEVEITSLPVSEDDAPPSPEGPHRIQVDYAAIAKTLKVGCHVLLDDGLIALEVVDIDPNLEYVKCIALNSGPIKKNKGVNLPNATIDLPALTDKDKRDLYWSCEVGADYVAASFIRTPGNVRSVIAYLDRCIADLKAKDPNGPDRIRPLVISKIENHEGVDNFDGILKESDGIMVARGDLGVEIPYRKVFAVQKMMVKACNAAGKPVIVATQMLDSMQRNPRPTRAEVTDVGTAVLDGADAVMLSGETAAGAYPIESIKAMANIVSEADAIADQKRLFSDIHTSDQRCKMTPVEEELDATAQSAVRSAQDMKAKKIIVITMNGNVARAVARHNPTVPILAFCTDAQVARRLQLHRAITPILLQSSLDPGDSRTRMGFLRAEAVRTAKELGFVEAGDRIITVDRTLGKPHDMFHYSYNMKLSTVRDMSSLSAGSSS